MYDDFFILSKKNLNLLGGEDAVFMISYTFKRILSLIPIILGVAIIVFLLIHFIPGDPAQTMLGERATPAQVEALRQSMGLNDPLHIQFGRFFNGLLHGDLGRSIMTKECFY